MLGVNLWHWSHFFTYSCASLCILGHQYPCVKALWDRDLPLVWLPQILSCNSSRSGSTTSRWMHSRYSLEKERLYNFWPSDNQNRGAFLHTLSASPFSLGKMSSLRNRTIGSIQLGLTLSWWTWTFFLSISVGLHKSSTKMTWGRLCAEEVARLVRESKCVFLFLGIQSKEKESNLDCRCLFWFKYSCILTSLASSSPFTWSTTNIESENIFTTLPPIFRTIAVPSSKTLHSATLFVA